MNATFINTEEAYVLATVKEFVKSWGSGSQTSLNLECKNGQAWIHFSSLLGPPATCHYVPHHPRQGGVHGSHGSPNHPRPRMKGPGQVRRDLARAAAHREKLNQLDATKSADPVELEADNPSPLPPSPSPAAPADPLSPPPAASADPSSPPPAPPPLLPSDTAVQTLPTLGAHASVPLEVVDEVFRDDADDHLEKVVEVVEVRKPAEQVENIVEVLATAVFEDCPHGELNSEYSDSFNRFIYSEEHLVKNIIKYQTEHLSTRRMRTNLFTHTFAVKLFVRTEKLWESARSYLWKHIGQNEWTRSNGTRLNLIRIHVK